MPIDLIHYKSGSYPAFQATGNAAQFAIPFARQVCKGVGVDVGCGKEEWKFPEAIPVDPVIDGSDALHFPLEIKPGTLDYVFSSHCLEHLANWVTALDYWGRMLKPEGVMFLYLPDFSQVYWQPWNNRKHVHVLVPTHIGEYFFDRGYKKVFVSGVDLNNSFMAMAEKGRII